MDLIPSKLTNYTLESYLIKITSRSKIIYWIIIGMVIIGISILPFIYVDVSVQARGFFQSEIEKQIIYAPFHGKIVFTSVKNGNEVSKGDTLFIIDSETTKAQQNALRQKIFENNSAISDLEKLTGIDKQDIQFEEEDFCTKRYFTEFNNLKKLQLIQIQKCQKTKSDFERNDLLHKQSIIPDIEFENSLYAYKAEEANLNQILIYQMSVWQADLMQRKNEAGSLQADFDRCKEELNNRVVLAPLSGEIIQSSDIQPGSMIGQNQKVAEISPTGQLVATCFVKPGDIGLVNKNQKVRIQVDAFNYNEWGLLNASIIDISDDMIMENGSNACFRIKCKPEKMFLSLKNGLKADLKKGMSFNARIVVIRRSLFNLLFDKVDKWFNPYLNGKT